MNRQKANQERLGTPSYIPEGFRHVKGTLETGFIIESTKRTDKSQFDWIPVNCLGADGTLDNNEYKLQFGRRCFGGTKAPNCSDPFDQEFLELCHSIKKYGGFYYSCYHISKSSKGKPISVKWRRPWTDLNFDTAKQVAASYEVEGCKAILPYGAAHDTVLAWFIQTKARTLEEIHKNSSGWGNYYDGENPIRGLCQTGHDARWYTNGIADFAGNVAEWTQEQCGTKRVVRGGGWDRVGRYFPADKRDPYDPESHDETFGFRIVLYKPA